MHVKRCQKDQPKNIFFFIPSKVGNPTDKTAFDKLYDTKSLKLRLDKVFLFGLLHFCDKYDRLGNHIELVFKDTTCHSLYIFVFTLNYCVA